MVACWRPRIRVASWASCGSTTAAATCLGLSCAWPSRPRSLPCSPSLRASATGTTRTSWPPRTAGCCTWTTATPSAGSPWTPCSSTTPCRAAGRPPRCSTESFRRPWAMSCWSVSSGPWYAAPTSASGGTPGCWLRWCTRPCCAGHGGTSGAAPQSASRPGPWPWPSLRGAARPRLASAQQSVLSTSCCGTAHRMSAAHASGTSSRACACASARSRPCPGPAAQPSRQAATPRPRSATHPWKRPRRRRAWLQASSTASSTCWSRPARTWVRLAKATPVPAGHWLAGLCATWRRTPPGGSSTGNRRTSTFQTSWIYRLHLHLRRGCTGAGLYLASTRTVALPSQWRAEWEGHRQRALCRPGMPGPTSSSG
mmetsp:Transcript_43513/g.134808  ORF Transcript_43513/g.134808 Transcript_43513/m.134808 type:complete len:369 (-) Transcript_43513:295-1401(-)